MQAFIGNCQKVWFVNSLYETKLWIVGSWGRLQAKQNWILNLGHWNLGINSLFINFIPRNKHKICAKVRKCKQSQTKGKQSQTKLTYSSKLKHSWIDLNNRNQAKQQTITKSVQRFISVSKVKQKLNIFFKKNLEQLSEVQNRCIVNCFLGNLVIMVNITRLYRAK